ncbi:MAG: toxin-antitoxin system HicB family antitoxin [Gaiellaceae bacterium]
MQTSQFIEALQADLRELAQIGGEELVQAAHRLEGAVKQSATLRLIDALGQVALDLSAQLPNGHIDVRVAGQDPELVYVEEEPEEPQPVAGDDGTAARISLRLPEPLKAAIEAAADAEGVSVNAWLVRALQRAVSGGGSGRAHRSDKRITGFAQS